MRNVEHKRAWERAYYHRVGKAKRKAYNAIYRENNKEKVAAAKRAWAEANPEKRRVSVKSWYKAHPDSAREFNRKCRHKRLPIPTRPEPEACECCGAKPLRGHLALDHCHVTDRFRGWLCSKCNVGIGALGDCLEAVRNAVEYLERAT